MNFKLIQRLLYLLNPIQRLLSTHTYNSSNFQSTSQNSKAIWRHSVLTIQRLMSHKLIQRSQINETLHKIRIIIFSSSSLPFTVKKCLFLSHSSFSLKLKKIHFTHKKKESFSLLRPFISSSSSLFRPKVSIFLRLSELWSQDHGTRAAGSSDVRSWTSVKLLTF